LEWNKRRSRAVSSDVEDTIEVIETAPVAPQAKRTEINAHLKERVVATKVKTLMLSLQTSRFDIRLYQRAE
jgi:hypothetical protein